MPFFSKSQKMQEHSTTWQDMWKKFRKTRRKMPTLRSQMNACWKVIELEPRLKYMNVYVETKPLR